MTIKGSDIVNKVMGSGLLIASIGFFSDIMVRPEYMIPGFLFGAGGFWLAVRREKRAAPELEAQQRLEQLSEGLASVQHELAATTDRLERLEEEREFMRQLTVPARPAVAPPPDAPPLITGAQSMATREEAGRR